MCTFSPSDAGMLPCWFVLKSLFLCMLPDRNAQLMFKLVSFIYGDIQRMSLFITNVLFLTLLRTRNERKCWMTSWWYQLLSSSYDGNIVKNSNSDLWMPFSKIICTNSLFLPKDSSMYKRLFSVSSRTPIVIYECLSLTLFPQIHSSYLLTRQCTNTCSWCSLMIRVFHITE